MVALTRSPQAVESVGRRAKAYALAGLGVVVAVAVRLSLDPLFGSRFPYAPLVVVALWASTYGGAGRKFVLCLQFMPVFHTFFQQTYFFRMLEQYIPIGFMFVIAIGFGIVMSKLSEWLGPKNPNEVKLYESGMEPILSARERVSVKYYMVAMLFILFDIEVVFLYPWAVNFRALGMFGFVEMLLFVAVLTLGYIYLLKKGALKWQ